MDKNIKNSVRQSFLPFLNKAEGPRRKNISLRQAFDGWKSGENCAMLNLHKRKDAREDLR